MIANRLQRILLWGSAGIVLLMGGALLVWDQTQSDAALIASVSERVEQDLHADLQQLKRRARRGAPPLVQEGKPPTLLLSFSAEGELLRWSSRNFIPSQRTVQRHIDDPSPGLLRGQGRLYYNYKVWKGDSLVDFYLFPLRIQYPIENEYLQEYLYLGGLRDNVDTSPLHFSHRVLESPSDQAVNLTEPFSEDHLVSWSFRDWQPFRERRQLWAFWLLMLGLVLLIGAIYDYLCRALPRRWHAELIILGGVVLIRLLLIYLRLPQSYVPTQLFSSSVLAINFLNPSLGDLSLNLVLVVFIAYHTYQLLPQDQLGQHLRALGPQARLGLGLVGILLGTYLVEAYFQVFSRLVMNSHIYFEFANFFRLDVFSYLVFFNLALLLASIFMAVYFLAGVLHASTPRTERFRLGLQLGGALLVVGGGAALAGLFTHAYVLPIVLVFLSGLFLLRRYSDTRLRFGLFRGLAIFALFAGMTNLAVSQSLENNTRSNLRSLARKYADQKNLITEYTFDGVIENIRKDTSLWHTDTSALDQPNPYATVVAKIINNHLLKAFKRYDFRVFLFRDRRRLDNQFDLQPYRLTPEAKRQGQTLSENLFLVPYKRSVTQNIYVGRVPIKSKVYGRLSLQIELHPKTYLSSKLYPRLLLDHSIRQKLTIPPEYAVAIYVGGQLTRKEGSGDFPVTIQPDTVRTDTVMRAGDGLRYADRPMPDKLIVTKAPQRSTFDKITGFSFLFYFFVLLYLLYLLPGALRNLSWDKLRTRSHSLSVRLQFFMAVLTLVPLIVIWGLTTPLFQRFYFEETRRFLRLTLEHVSSYLESEPSFLNDFDRPGGQPGPATVDLLTRISDILASDINLYDAEGDLYLSTRPKIYQMGLISRQINPQAYEQLLRRGDAYLVVDEHIGRLTYFSGYMPIFGNAGQQLGFVNIPFLSQQDVLRNQLRRFIAYLINVYVVLILILIIAGLFVLKTLTNPLRLLRQKLESTRYGSELEPINWRSQDEIGQIIGSYNQMLGRLRESEQKLAKSERELAWREMARQVAHEIKNPLTPMKLSVQHLMRTLGNIEDERTRAKVKQLSETLITQIDSLTTIANSFSQFSKWSPAQTTPQDLRDILREVEALYADTEDLELSLELPAQPAVAAVDKNQLSQVMVNLIRNAHQAGATQLSIRLEGHPGEHLLRFSDNGNGIPEEIQDRIFDPNFSTKTSGMGLGLGISRRIVDSMGGQIWFESTPGEGTTFYLNFPAFNDQADAAVE